MLHTMDDLTDPQILHWARQCATSTCKLSTIHVSLSVDLEVKCLAPKLSWALYRL